MKDYEDPVLTAEVLEFKIKIVKEVFERIKKIKKQVEKKIEINETLIEN